MVPYFLFIVLIQPFFFSYNRLREAVSLNHWWSLIFQYFSEFSVLKTFYLNLMQGSFWFICSALPLLLCTTLGSEIKLFLFGSGSKEKCPCFETEIRSLLGRLSSFSPCFLSVTPLPIFCIAFWVTGVCLSLCKCSIIGRDGYQSSLESVCFSHLYATRLQIFDVTK